MVERDLPVAAGSHHVEVGGLPTNFATESLRLQSDSGVRVGQLAFKDQSTTASPSAREAELEKQIESLNDQKAALDVEAQSAGTVKDLLGRLSLSGEKGSVLTINAQTFAGVLAEVRKASSDALNTIRKVGVQKRALDKQIDALNRDLERLRSGRRDTRVVAFDVAAERDGVVRISYPASGAGWHPAYRALLDSESGRIVLERQAVIFQRTGEDWRDVEMRLSTGQPQLAVSGPEPTAWLVQKIEPMPMEGERKTMGAVGRAMAAPAPAMQAMAKDEAVAAPPPVQEFQTTFATEFSVPGRVNLSADGTEVTLALGQKDLEATLRLRTTPRLEAAAYLEAEATRPEGDWLPGKVQLMRDGDYVGEQWWQPQQNDKLVLPFGRDALVRVTYDRTKQNWNSPGLLSHRKSREVVDLFTVTSRHKTSMPLLVLEPSPVSTSDEIKVEREFTPKPDEQDWQQQSGVVAWRAKLEPSAKLQFQSHYTVSYPENAQIVGLP